MSERTYFFSPPRDVITPERASAVLGREWKIVYEMLTELSWGWCPVCQTMVKGNEIHVVDGRSCARIINLSIPT